MQANGGNFIVPFGKHYGRPLRDVPVDYILDLIVNASNLKYPGLPAAAEQYLQYLEAHPEECIVPLTKYRDSSLQSVDDTSWMRWCCTANTEGMQRAREWHPTFMRIMESRLGL